MSADNIITTRDQAPQDRLTVGFVGAGSMGSPTVCRLVATGTAVQLAVRDAEAREKWSNVDGVSTHALPAQAAENATAFVVFVRTEEQVMDVLVGNGGVLPNLAPNALLILHSTIGTHSADVISELAIQRGIGYVDAPVDGSDSDVANGKLVVLLGGADDDVRRAQHIVGSYAAHQFVVGPAGAATGLKLINNLLLAANIQVAASALKIGQDVGLRAPLAGPALARMTAGSGALDLLNLFGGDFEQLAAAAGPHLGKDVELALASLPHTVAMSRLADLAGNGLVALGSPDSAKSVGDQ